MTQIAKMDWFIFMLARVVQARTHPLPSLCVSAVSPSKSNIICYGISMKLQYHVHKNERCMSKTFLGSFLLLFLLLLFCTPHHLLMRMMIGWAYSRPVISSPGWKCQYVISATKLMDSELSCFIIVDRTHSEPSTKTSIRFFPHYFREQTRTHGTNV